MNIRLNLAILATALVCAVQAAVSFAYQGVLKDAQGKALSTKTPTVSFRLYDSQSGTAVLWGRSISVLLDDAGLFNVELSDTNGGVISAKYSKLEDALKATASSTLYIGVQVGSANEIRPRQRVLSVPFATIAGDVKSTSGDLGVQGKVTAKSALVSDTAQVNGDVVLKGKLLEVSGSVTFKNKLTVSNGGMAVTGSAQFNDAVVMQSSLSAKSISIGGSPVSIAEVGMVMMWYGNLAEIPNGWRICDGQEGTPDLRGMFVAGATSDEATGDYGVKNPNVRGADSVTLTVNQMPKHNHIYYGDDQINNGVGLRKAIEHQKYNFDMTSKGDQKGSTYYTTETGGSASHENRPKFKALYYIMYVGVK